MWYWIFRNVFIVIFKTFFRLIVRGTENVPPKTNFIIVANHSSFLDAVVIMAAVPQKIYCIALRDLYKVNWLGWLLKVTETLPSGSASPKAVNLLLNNKNVGLFPEGGVSRDGKLKEFRRGAALLAVKTGRPIVPCAIFGTFKALPFRAKFPKFMPLKLIIGKPIFLLQEPGEVVDDFYLQEGTLRVKNAIREMLNAG